MIEQDYILKILQEFFEAIAKVVRRSDEDDEAIVVAIFLLTL